MDTVSLLAGNSLVFVGVSLAHLLDVDGSSVLVTSSEGVSLVGSLESVDSLFNVSISLGITLFNDSLVGDLSAKAVSESLSLYWWSDWVLGLISVETLVGLSQFSSVRFWVKVLSSMQLSFA